MAQKRGKMGRRKSTNTTTRTTTTSKRAGGVKRALYPKGTPVDRVTGTPLVDVEMSKRKARTIPLDAASARVTQQHQEILERKGNGEIRVHWNSSDPRIRYMQCSLVYPHCQLALRQVSPKENELPGVPISSMPKYQDLVEYLRKFWHEDDAIFEWKAHDQMRPQVATGTVIFAAIADNPRGEPRKSSSDDYVLQPQPDASVMLNNGENASPIATLASVHGGRAHIIVDDHCYVLVHNGNAKGEYRMSAWWFREAVAALHTLPRVPR